MLFLERRRRASELSGAAGEPHRGRLDHAEATSSLPMEWQGFDSEWRVSSDDPVHQPCDRAVDRTTPPPLIGDDVPCTPRLASTSPPPLLPRTDSTPTCNLLSHPTASHSTSPHASAHTSPPAAPPTASHASTLAVPAAAMPSSAHGGVLELLDARWSSLRREGRPPCFLLPPDGHTAQLTKVASPRVLHDAATGHGGDGRVGTSTQATRTREAGDAPGVPLLGPPRATHHYWVHIRETGPFPSAIGLLNGTNVWTHSPSVAMPSSPHRRPSRTCTVDGTRGSTRHEHLPNRTRPSSARERRRSTGPQHASARPRSAGVAHHPPQAPPMHMHKHMQGVQLGLQLTHGPPPPLVWPAATRPSSARTSQHGVDGETEPRETGTGRRDPMAAAPPPAACSITSASPHSAHTRHPSSRPASALARVNLHWIHPTIPSHYLGASIGPASTRRPTSAPYSVSGVHPPRAPHAIRPESAKQRTPALADPLQCTLEAIVPRPQVRASTAGG